MLLCQHMYTNSHPVAMVTDTPMAMAHNCAAFFKLHQTSKIYDKFIDNTYFSCFLSITFMEACLYCLFEEQSGCPVTMETSVSDIFFLNCAACVTASCITICFILFIVTSSQSYKNDVFAILTENRHFVTMAIGLPFGTGKPLKLFLNSVTSITASCCHTLVEVIRFFVALSLHFHENRFWRPFL